MEGGKNTSLHLPNKIPGVEFKMSKNGYTRHMGICGSKTSRSLRLHGFTFEPCEMSRKKFQDLASLL